MRRSPPLPQEAQRPVTSRSNPQVRLLDELLRQKKARQASGLFALEGRRLVLDAWEAGLCPQTLYLTAGAWSRSADELAPLCDRAEQTVWLAEELAARVGDTQSPQGVFAVCHRPAPGPDGVQLKGDGRYLLLYRVRDPGNLGSILRTAAALGADGALLCDCAELYAPKTLRASMGGVWRLPVALWQEPGPMLAALREAGIPVLAAALRRDAAGPEGLSQSAGRAVLIGNEGDGLPEELINACDGAVMLPMEGGSDSLGAAMAAGILLWEMLRDRE